MRENIIRIYWQAMDSDGQVVLYHTEKPVSNGVNFGNRGQYDCYILFPIPLKPLQIAEITVNEDGTWSYEIEREEGWYMCFDTDKISPIVLQWTGGIFKAANGASFTEDWFKCNGWICEDKIESQLLNEIRK